MVSAYSIKKPALYISTSRFNEVENFLAKLRFVLIGQNERVFVFKNGGVYAIVEKETGEEKERHTKFQVWYPYTRSNCNFEDNAKFFPGDIKVLLELNDVTCNSDFLALDHLVYEWLEGEGKAEEWFCEKIEKLKTSEFEAWAFFPSNFATAIFAGVKLPKYPVKAGINHIALLCGGEPDSSIQKFSDSSNFFRAVYWSHKAEKVFCLSSILQQSFIETLFFDGVSEVKIELVWRKPILDFGFWVIAIPGDHYNQGFNSSAQKNNLGRILKKLGQK